MPTDTEFEKQFSDLAFSSLRDKAPGLFDHLVGFQVMDVNDDQTKAMGVFGCQLGHQWVYIPVFFLSGELKSGMMYLKEQDQFVPLQENWVSYVLQRRPYVLGEDAEHDRRSVFRNGADLGPYYLSPSQYAKAARYQRVKGIKIASMNIPCWAPGRYGQWMDPFLKASARQFGPAISLPDFLAANGDGAAATCMTLMRKESSFGRGVMTFYELPELLAPVMRKRAAQRGPEAEYCPKCDARQEKSAAKEEDPAKDNRITNTRDHRQEVEVLSYGPQSADSRGAGLSDKDKEKLMRGEPVVKDLRIEGEKSIAYRVDSPYAAGGVTETGLNSVLTKTDGEISTLIIQAPIAIGGGAVKVGGALVVDRDGGGYDLVDPSRVFAQGQEKCTKDWLDFYATLKQPDSMKVGKTYVIVSPDRKGTVPFTVMHKKDGLEGGADLWVDDHVHSRDYGRNCVVAGEESATRDIRTIDRRPYVDTNREHWNANDDKSKGAYTHWESGRKIVISKFRGVLTNLGGALFVPESSRVMEVDHAKRLPPMGDLRDLQEFLVNNNSATPLKVHSPRPGEFTVRAGNLGADGMGKIAALRHLVCQHGLDGDSATDLLKSAEQHTSARALVTYGPGYPVMNAIVKSADRSLSPPFPDDPPQSTWGRMPVDMAMARNIPVTSMSPSLHNTRDIYNPDPSLDQPTGDTVRSATQTGQREVFDATAIASLVKVMDSPSLVEKYLPDVTTGLDRIGRILFLYYQHPDTFEDQYGEEDLKELEDALRNNFKGLGDLVLFLRTRTADASQSMDRTRNDISAE